MIRAYGEKRKCYVIFPKGTIKREQALKIAAVELHEKVDDLEISYATTAGETDEKIEFFVEMKQGDLWCVSRKGNK